MTVPQPLPPECTVPLIQVDITEQLDLAHVPELGVVFDRILSLLPRQMVIDLSACRHIDAAGIGLLLEVHRRLAPRQGVLTLRNPNSRIRRVLDRARLDQVLPIVDTAGRPGSLTVDGAPTKDRPVGAHVAQGRAKVTA